MFLEGDDPGPSGDPREGDRNASVRGATRPSQPRQDVLRAEPLRRSCIACPQCEPCRRRIRNSRWSKCGRSVVMQGEVCPDPDRPCPGFKPNELSFKIAKPFKFDRGRDKSQPFYAVILKSAPICSINDEERLRAQKVFPRAKVFLHRLLLRGLRRQGDLLERQREKRLRRGLRRRIRGRGPAAARAGESLRLSGRQHPPSWKSSCNYQIE